MFYGFTSFEDLKGKLGQESADYLKSIAKIEEVKVCSRNKKCYGSIDGETYFYSDGSKDTGITVKSFRAKAGENIFAWTED